MKRQIFIKESELNALIYESVKCIISESQESKSRSAAKRLLIDKLGDENKAEETLKTIRDTFPALKDTEIAKFTLGITRMWCNNEINERNVSDINPTLKLMSAHLDEYDRNINGLSCDDLIAKFAQIRSDNLENEKNEINQMTFGNSQYQIVPINSFKEARKYNKYTYKQSPWCLTYLEDQYDAYTCDGINQIYFCLRNDFKDVKPIVEENAPLDNYGLSMISIIVNERGELVYCTTRWNHKNGGTDSVMTTKEVSQVIGVNFFQTFKPNNKWDEMLNVAKQRLANNEPLESIFDYVDDFRKGFASVLLGGKWNFVNTNNKLISNQWFDKVSSFRNGFAMVQLGKKYNFINTNGKLIGNQWYDYVHFFREGFAEVQLDGKCNFINTNGKLIGNQWYDYVDDFREGFAMVRLGKKRNVINTNGKLISNQWFDYVDDFREGFAEVQLDGKYNFINTNYKLISNQWYDYATNFSEGFAEVQLDGKWNFINTNGELISKKWYDGVSFFKEGFAMVRLDGKWNFINTNGKPIGNQWYDDVDIFREGFAMVRLDGKYNFINTNGRLISKKWYDYVGNFIGRFAMVQLDGKMNFINTNYKLISKKWFDKVSSFRDGFAMVQLDGKMYFINTNGKIVRSPEY